MGTSYIRFVQSAEDPVWGTQALDWIRTGLVRVYRNRLKKAVFEWVGNPKQPFDLEAVRKNYPICIYASEGYEPAVVEYRGAMPLPDRKNPSASGVYRRNTVSNV
jgi:hypothetical protein